MTLDGTTTPAVFDRGIDEAFVSALNVAYDEGGWWRRLADDTDLVVAIRSNYLNVYWRGNSLLRVAHEKGRLVGRVHYKYLLRPDRTPEYVGVKDGRAVIPDPASFLTQDIGDVQSLKAAAKPYAGAEKIGVHNIVMSNPNIVDVEVAFAVAGMKGDAGNPRVDFAAVHEMANEVRLVFYEAKLFSNAEARAGGDAPPRVVEQIGRYASLLRQHDGQVERSYNRVFTNLLTVKGVVGRHPERDAVLRKVLSGEKPVVICDRPRLVLFGFDDDQKRGAVWAKHRGKLVDLLGADRVLLRGSSVGFTTGISAP
ncbi:hypothetical protein HL658_03535 [Azospirillum sp. RWY-5-1]|uniref:Uncharacterized protein n=1 Tax=Azospirillum oleiclasticum TaxID=2735135 RepID=A0ABX2T7W1_9PROT|nr:hypothetical protein [Azospirillum oleiclasticum]NYZ11609.1 hypothetical protein [Azospirillum oleiclasticum]NYZ18770.1 hypothetical protein [Azospirillum oleiclasticum]